MTNRRLFIACIALLLAGVVLCVAFAAASAAPASPADPCDPATMEQCCACEPAEAAEPAPLPHLPHLYLPAVMREPRMPPPEYTPAMPIATPEPPVSGDVQ